jgi:hypothetical protein
MLRLVFYLSMNATERPGCTGATILRLAGRMYAVERHRDCRPEYQYEIQETRYT